MAPLEGKTVAVTGAAGGIGVPVARRLRQAGARVIGWQSGKVLDYDAGVLLFADVYELRHVMHRDEVAPCTAGA